MMETLHFGIMVEVQPETMNQLYVVGLQCRYMGSDVKGLCFAVRGNHKESKLSLDILDCFPRLTNVEGLIFRCHPSRKTGDNRVCFQRVSCLNQSREYIAGGNNQKRYMLAETLSDGD